MESQCLNMNASIITQNARQKIVLNTLSGVDTA
uniref:Uncharacterized protein n=1 Tax=Timema tahoe TaxID=61484 RepID=A0A7R9IUF9_9NEOP|nr:unnamed protein product [Timema tahoe]